MRRARERDEKLRRNKAEPVGKYAESEGERRWRALDGPCLRQRWDEPVWRNAMPGNPPRSRGELENQVFSFFTHFSVFSAAIFTASTNDGVHHTTFSHFTFFAPNFPNSSLGEWRRRADGCMRWVSQGTYSLLSCLGWDAGWPVCSVQRTKSFLVAHSWWSFLRVIRSDRRTLHCLRTITLSRFLSRWLTATLKQRIFLRTRQAAQIFTFALFELVKFRGSSLSNVWSARLGHFLQIINW